MRITKSDFGIFRLDFTYMGNVVFGPLMNLNLNFTSFITSTANNLISRAL